MRDTTKQDAVWTPLDAAAGRLGISPDATRKRIERGSLTGEKRSGRWYVQLPDPDASPDAAKPDDSGQPDATRTPLDAVPDMTRELIDQLRSENQFLRDQLDHSRRELSAERERFDVIHREALQRIEALSPGSRGPEPEETAENTPVDRDVAPGRDLAVKSTSDATNQPTGKRIADLWHWMRGR
jgi:hypothetical protein